MLPFTETDRQNKKVIYIICLPSKYSRQKQYTLYKHCLVLLNWNTRILNNALGLSLATFFPRNGSFRGNNYFTAVHIKYI